MADLMNEFDPTSPLPQAGRTILLEASAGTGKTHQIASLVCRYIEETPTTIEQLLLVTFGNAATEELRTRVFAELSGRSELPDLPAENRERLKAALASFDQATIATTHTFCSLMLDRLGVLADWDADARFTGNLTELVSDVTEDLYLRRYADLPVPPFSLSYAKAIGDIVVEHSDRLYECDAHAEELAFAEGVRELVRARKARASLYTYDDLIDRMLTTMGDPATGELARVRLSASFPVVLVDEFQDTDPQQWSILRDAFVNRSSVVLIGDPKQSIYGFRNADLNSYLEALSQSDERYTLNTNWRSDPNMARAVGSLFEGTQLGDDRVVVRPVSSGRSINRLTRADGSAAPAIRIRAALPTAQRDPEIAGRITDTDVVAQVAELLKDYALDGMSVRPGDIAILVRQRDQAHAIMRLLGDAGIPAVFPGAESVLATQAARDWVSVLTAWHSPTPRNVRAAAVTGLIGVPVETLAAEGDVVLNRIAADLHITGQLAESQGIAAAWHSLQASFSIAERLVKTPAGEALFTDLWHCAELIISAQWHNHLTIEGTRSWLMSATDRSGSRDDETSRRLSTDADAVRVLTMHGAKGLQFPIVLLPSVSEWTAYGEKRPFTFTHDGRRQIFVGQHAERGARWAEHLRDARAEELRLLYVAFTRAQSGVIAWWSPSRNTPSAPLHRLLCRAGAAEPRNSYPVTAASSWRSGPDLRIETITPGMSANVEPQVFASSGLAVRTFTRTVDKDWCRTSYSALTSETHDIAEQISDEPELGEPVTTDAADLTAPLPLAALPGGTAFGSLVHLVLEHLDWSATDLGTELDGVLGAELPRLPIGSGDPAELRAGLLAALHTPLGGLTGGRRLVDIPTTDRLAELDFDLPVGTAGRATVSDIAQIMAEHLPPGDLLHDYPGRLISSAAAPRRLNGFLTGSIDAVLRVDGTYLVIDYKTNRMPTIADEELTVGHYRPGAMAEAMMASHYPLQALLYSVALHRFLSWRLASYDPEIHLGGVGYLFVRGMIGPDTPVVDGMPCGVFTWHPGAGLVIAASEALGGRHG